jgi:hypothetical protein
MIFAQAVNSFISSLFCSDFNKLEQALKSYTLSFRALESSVGEKVI